MKTLYFIRHGQSTANAGGVTLDNSIIPLSDLGLLQAKKLATESLHLLPQLPYEVYTSSYLRTQQTAIPYCQAVNTQPKICTIFHEFTNIDPRLLQGMTGDERWPFVKSYWEKSDPYWREGSGAETFIEFDKRVSEFIQHIPEFEHHTVFFGHGLFFSLLIWKILGFTVTNNANMLAFRQFQLALPMPNCAIYALNYINTNHNSHVLSANYLLQMKAVLV